VIACRYSELVAFDVPMNHAHAISPVLAVVVKVADTDELGEAVVVEMEEA
jgi:hypothetical protein